MGCICIFSTVMLLQLLQHLLHPSELEGTACKRERARLRHMLGAASMAELEDGGRWEAQEVDGGGGGIVIDGDNAMAVLQLPKTKLSREWPFYHVTMLPCYHVMMRCVCSVYVHACQCCAWARM